MLRIWDFACSSSSPFRFAAGVLERAAFKSRFSNSSGFRSGLYWKEFVFLLLESMPSKTAEHYRNKIAVYLCWWMTKGGKPDGIPDECERDLISEDLYPSWRSRIRINVGNKNRRSKINDRGGYVCHRQRLRNWKTGTSGLPYL